MSAELLPLDDVPGNRSASSVAGRVQVSAIARHAPSDCAPKPPMAQSQETAFALVVSRAMGVVVVTAHGHLGASEAGVLEAVLVDLIEGQGNLKVVVDFRDVSGLDPSSLEVLVAATAAAAQRGGQLTFADPSEAGTRALEAVGLGAAIILARQCNQRAVAPRPPGQTNGSARRAAMAEHPAGTASHREHPSVARPQHEGLN
jgi:anti-anti-sigma factor